MVDLIHDDQAELAEPVCGLHEPFHAPAPGQGLDGGDHHGRTHVVRPRLDLARVQVRGHRLELVPRLIGQFVAVDQDDDTLAVVPHVLGCKVGEQDGLPQPGRHDHGRALHPLGPRGVDRVDRFALVRAERQEVAHRRRLP